MTKIIITLSILLGLNFSAHTQPVVGALSPGGSINGSFSKNANGLPNNYEFRIAVMPNLGKFISEKYMLSGSVGYSLVHRENYNSTGVNRSNRNSFSIGVGITRYARLTDKFYFTLGANLSPFFNLNYSYGVTSGISNSADIGASVSIAPGLTYFLNQKWGVYSTFGALSYIADYFHTSGEMSHTVGLNLNGNNFNLGIRYFIQPKNNRESK